MITLLLYLVVAALIGAVVFLIAMGVFGRGERMAPLPPHTSPAQLPSADIQGEDVRAVRFALALRGYRMSDVDWTLDRLSTQLDELWVANNELRRRLGEPEVALVGARERAGESSGSPAADSAEPGTAEPKSPQEQGGESGDPDRTTG